MGEETRDRGTGRKGLEGGSGGKRVELGGGEGGIVGRRADRTGKVGER